MINRRGLSQVVTTVIIILVVLAAIVLIWAAVRPTIQSASERITADCITLELDVESCAVGAPVLDSGSCSVTDTTVCTIDDDCPLGETCDGVQFGESQIRVSRNSGSGELTGVVFVYNDGTTETIDKEDSTLPNPLETRTFNVEKTLSPGDTVNVAGVVGQGNVCSVSSSGSMSCS